jgi:predicted negative regulator of RcsB-dependent stress response
MLKNILNNKKIICVAMAAALLSLTAFIHADQEPDNILFNIENINISSKMIEDKKYEEAIEILHKVENVDFYYLKNQQLGDISFLTGKYEEALSFYNIAQVHSKDKIMYEYMSKKMDYIKTTKLIK